MTLVGLGSLSIQVRIERDFRTEVSDSLRTVRDTTHQAVRSWIKEHKTAVRVWAESREIRNFAAALLASHRSGDSLFTSPAQSELRRWLQPVQAVKGYQGYFIIGPDNINLSASHDPIIGAMNPLADQHKFMQKIWDGNVAVSLPIGSATALPDSVRGVREGSSAMYVGAPIRDKTGEVIAIFAFRINPMDDFAAILRQGRSGHTGETYAFDSHGSLISETRFERPLHDVGMPTANERRVLKIETRDPGVNQLKGELESQGSDNLPLTLMAREAIRAGSWSSVDRYLGYRGVPVVGAWIWDHDLDFGIATQIETGEAYKTLHATRYAINSLTLLVILILAAATAIYVVYRQRKLAESALRHSRDILNKIIDAVPVHLAITRASDGQVLRANQSAADFHRLTMDDLTDKCTLDVYANPGDRDRLVRKLQEQGRLEGEEVTLKRIASGEHRDCLASAYPIEYFGEQANLIGVVDITDRKRAEEEIQHREKRFRMLFEQSPDPTYITDIHANLIDANERACRELGYTREELLQLHVTDIDHDFRSRKDEDSFWESMPAGETTTFEVTHHRKDGSSFPAEMHLSVIHVGQEAFLLGIARNLTEKKRAEQALEKSERKYRELVDDVATIVLRWDTNGDVTFINEYGQRFFGFSADELVGKNVVGTIVPQTEFTGRDLVDLMEQIRLDPAKFENNENENIRRNGERVWIAWRNKPIFNDRGKLVEIHSVGIDLSDKKRYENALRRTQVFELLATGASLDDVLMTLVDNAEKRDPDILCSIMLLDNDARHLHFAAAPSLPEFLTRATDGIEIGEGVASCAHSAYTGERLIVEDIAAHPNWERFTHLAEKAGLRACWSEPILAADKTVLGTFAVYYKEKRAPKQPDLEFIQDTARLAAIAIERTRSEEKIRASEGELRGILNSLQDVYYRTDNEGRVTRASPSSLQVFGYLPEEAVGTSIVTYWRYPEKRQEMIEAMQAGGGAVENFEVEAIHKDGSNFWASVNAHFYLDEKYEIAGIEGTIRDITESKHREDQLVRFKATLDRTNDCVFMFRPDDLQFFYVNQGAIKQTGYTEDELLAMRPFDIKPDYDEEAFRGQIAPLIRGDKQGLMLETRHRRKDGRIIPVDISLQYVAIPGEDACFVAIVRDVTDRKASEEATRGLLQQNRSLTQRLFNAQENERRYLARELHDEFGQWLTAIQLEAQAISGLYSEKNPRIQESVQAISDSAAEIHTGIRRMMRSLRPAVLDQLGLLESLRELVGQWQSHNPDVRIEVTLTDDLTGLGEFTDITVYRVVQEVLNNIAKHARASQVIVRLDRLRDAAGAGGYLSLSIQDDGVGMDTSKQSSGMGLAGMRERVVTSGGDFLLHSREGQGTRIKATFPIKQ